MNSMIRAAAVAAIGFGASGLAFGQSFVFTDNDLLVGFTQPGAQNSLTLDLGNVESFVDGAYHQGGSSAQTVTVPDGALVATEFSTSLANISWSAQAAYNTHKPAGEALSTYFLTTTRSAGTTYTYPTASLTGLSRAGASTQATPASNINNLGLGSQQYTQAALGGGTLDGSSSATAAIIPVGDSHSYPSAIGTSTAFGTSKSLTTVQNKTQIPTSGHGNILGREDLWQLVPGTGKGVDLGYFTLSSVSGATVLTYTPLAAVPEPSTYAAVTALALAGFGLWRRRSAK